MNTHTVFVPEDCCAPDPCDCHFHRTGGAEIDGEEIEDDEDEHVCGADCVVSCFYFQLDPDRFRDDPDFDTQPRAGYWS